MGILLLLALYIDGRRGKMNTSSYCYPQLKYEKEYVAAIENLDDPSVRRVIKLILVSGFRVGEILNSYLFYDAEGNVIIRSLAGKSRLLREEGITMRGNSERLESRFLGEHFLNSLIRSNRNVFKSVKIENILQVDTTELEDLIGEDMLKPRYVAPQLRLFSYLQAYRRLHNSVEEFAVKYRKDRQEEGAVIYARPSFHFYRKLYAVKYYDLSKRNLLKTIDKMRWSNVNMILHYVKEYD